jgi:hypothetical protein
MAFLKMDGFFSHSFALLRVLVVASMKKFLWHFGELAEGDFSLRDYTFLITIKMSE